MVCKSARYGGETMAERKTPDDQVDNSGETTDDEDFLAEIGLDSSGDWNGVAADDSDPKTKSSAP